MGADSSTDAIIVAIYGPVASLGEAGISRIPNIRKTDISRILVAPVDYVGRIFGALNETRNAHKGRRYIEITTPPSNKPLYADGGFCTCVAHFSERRAHLFRGFGYLFICVA